MNAYEILQVNERASAEVIRAAWAALIRECHPDGEKPNEKRARALNDAYAILKDPKKKLALDNELDFARRSKAVTAPKPAKQRVRETPVNFPDAYPPAYLGFSADQIDEAIERMTHDMHPAAKLVVDMAKDAVLQNIGRQRR